MSQGIILSLITHRGLSDSARLLALYLELTAPEGSVYSIESREELADALGWTKNKVKQRLRELENQRLINTNGEAIDDFDDCDGVWISKDAATGQLYVTP